jgi:hypothetical protein
LAGRYIAEHVKESVANEKTKDKEKMNRFTHFGPPEMDSYVSIIVDGLTYIYSGIASVKTEWYATLSEETLHSPRRIQFPRKMYGPRIDIAVGPFATDQQFSEDYDFLLESSEHFIEEIIAFHHQNIREFGSDYTDLSFEQLKLTNPNPRCFIAIEIERQTADLKYLMGSMVNAMALGKIGIAVAWGATRLQGFLRVREYLMYLKSLEKSTFNLTNLVILDKEQLQQAVEGCNLPQH